MSDLLYFIFVQKQNVCTLWCTVTVYVSPVSIKHLQFQSRVEPRNLWEKPVCKMTNSTLIHLYLILPFFFIVRSSEWRFIQMCRNESPIICACTLLMYCAAGVNRRCCVGIFAVCSESPFIPFSDAKRNFTEWSRLMTSA